MSPWAKTSGSTVQIRSYSTERVNANIFAIYNRARYALRVPTRIRNEVSVPRRIGGHSCHLRTARHIQKAGADGDRYDSHCRHDAILQHDFRGSGISKAVL